MSLLEHGVPQDAFAELSCFRTELYACLTGRRDALFELSDALLCTDGPVKTLFELSLEPEHRRGHGALYGGLNCGNLNVARLRTALAGLPLPRTAQGGGIGGGCEQHPPPFCWMNPKPFPALNHFTIPAAM